MLKQPTKEICLKNSPGQRFRIVFYRILAYEDFGPGAALYLCEKYNFFVSLGLSEGIISACSSSVVLCLHLLSLSPLLSESPTNFNH